MLGHYYVDMCTLRQLNPQHSYPGDTDAGRAEFGKDRGAALGFAKRALGLTGSQCARLAESEFGGSAYTVAPESVIVGARVSRYSVSCDTSVAYLGTVLRVALTTVPLAGEPPMDCEVPT